VEIENKEILNSFGPVDKKPFSREVGDAIAHTQPATLRGP
jgi:hypothetical protein